MTATNSMATDLVLCLRLTTLFPDLSGYTMTACISARQYDVSTGATKVPAVNERREARGGPVHACSIGSAGG
jgi:hypothetical protein